jgi:hypothetical protein
METYAGNITTPQQDDIDGVAAMYGYVPCTYSISPSAGNLTDSAGTLSVAVTASRSGCTWTTLETLSWVNLSPAGGTGNGMVQITVSANTGAARFGSVTIAGKTYIINQAAPVVLKTWYIDRDGDGYGDHTHSVEAVSRPTGYVTDNTDCDDSDSTIHPGAAEIRGDGIDQDCNGADWPLPITLNRDFFTRLALWIYAFVTALIP